MGIFRAKLAKVAKRKIEFFQGRSAEALRTLRTWREELLHFDP
jgi:hypothetical protein